MSDRKFKRSRYRFAEKVVHLPAGVTVLDTLDPNIMYIGMGRDKTTLKVNHMSSHGSIIVEGKQV